MKKTFTKLLAALALLVFMMPSLAGWGQSNYSATYTSNCTLTAGTNGSSCKVKVNNVEYDGIKVGTSSKGGDMSVTVPAGAKYLHIHVAAWNGVSNLSLNITPNSNVSPTSVSLKADDGISNNSPFTFSGTPSSTDYYKVITFTNALASETTFTFTTSIAKRFVIWGVNSEAAGSSTDPSISGTDPDPLDYNATNGSFTYTLDAQGTTGTVTPTVPSGSWISNLSASDGTVTFDCTTNPNVGSRTETVTITYSYTGGSKSDEVTVTQNGNPNTINNVTDITTLGTTYRVRGTVVAKNARGFVMGDGTGYVYYYNGNAAPSQNIEDKVTITGPTAAYGHILQFSSSTTPSATIETATTSNYNNTPAVTIVDATAIAAYNSDYQLSDYVQYEGMLSTTTTTGNNPTTYYDIAVTDGTNSATARISYPTSDQIAELNNLVGNVVRVKGYFAGFSSNCFTTMLESIALAPTPTITLNPTSIALGTVEVGQQVSRTFTVAQSNLTAAITVSVTAGKGQLNLEGQPAANSVTIAKDAATTTVTWTYTPTTDGQSINSTITASSDGAASKTLTITGTAATFYDVTFDANGGTFVGSTDLPNASNHVPAGEYTLPSVTPATGYNFDKWNIGEATYDAGASYTVTGNAEFVASYTTGPTVTYDFTTSTINNATVATYFYTNADKTTHAALETNYATLYYENGDVFTASWPTTSGNQAQFKGGYYYLGKNGAYLVLPAFNFDVEKIEVVGKSGASGNTVMNIYTTVSGEDVAVSEATTGSTGTNTYNINENYQTAGTVYKLKISSSHNAQITAINIYQASSDTPRIVVSPDAVSSDATGETKTLNITVANLGIDTDHPENYLSNFSAEFCSSTGGEISPRPDFIGFDFNVVSGAYVVECEFTGNTGAAREGYFHVIYDDGTINVASNVVYATQDAYVAPVATITVYPDAMNVAAAGTGCTHTISIENMTISGISALNFAFCNASGNVITEGVPTWITDVTFATDGTDYTVGYVVSANTESSPRTAYFKVYATPVGASEPVYSNLVTVTQAGVATTTTYTLTTSILPGKQYIFVGSITENNTTTYYAMGAQDGKKRNAVTISVDGTIATVSSTDNVSEFTIAKPDANEDKYSIYDANWNTTGGYLYASSSSSNQLETEAALDNDGNGLWTIVIENGEATITAQGTNSRKLMRFNPNKQSGVYSPLFNCYANSNTGSLPMIFVKNETHTLSITGYENGGGWNLIATPLASYSFPSNTMVSGDYDLYRFNEAAELEWENYKANGTTQYPNHNDFETLEAGRGYLYANKVDIDISITGMPYTGDGQFTLNYTEGAEFAGWNLIGNPYNATAYFTEDRDFVIMNPDTKNSFIVAERKYINAKEGVFVQADGSNESVTFTTTQPNSGKAVDSNITINVIGNNDMVADRAIVRFGKGNTLHKLMFKDDDTKLYIPMDNKSYSVVRSNGQGTMPVNFKAKEMGKYTISVETEGIDLNYLHLIDRLTGEDVNLLLENKYSFIASNSDMESRFILSFTENGYNADSNDTFAFQNGSEIIVNGEGELQIFDVMGRMVKNTVVNGVETFAMPQGVYIFRLNEKVQKIVVR